MSTVTYLLFAIGILFWLSHLTNKQKTTIFHCLTFPAHTSCRGLSPCCSVWQVQLDEIPVSCVTLFLGNPRVPLNCMNTKPLWICHLPSFYLGLQAVFSHKAAQWLRAALSQVFLSVAFIPKTKRVVSMLSENYSLQDVSPSYLLLKATFHHLGKPSCPISHP